MGQALYRKYRSKTLDEIVGQSHITTLLKQSITSGNVAHAYLLTGPRGVGKTSIARILAHEINELPYDEAVTHVDIIEIDAASNNSVDDVRDLREKVRLMPVTAKKKVYIIDEVHMLSKQAFNALLKTLEEPPEHIIFILATTDADKLPATIISRVQRFNFRAITLDHAVQHLRTIATAENIAINDDALALIAKRGNGSFRDSIGLLDQMQNLTTETITAADIEALLGIASDSNLLQLLEAYERGDLQNITETLTALETESIPAATIADQLIRQVSRDLASYPERVTLLDKLTDVSRSAWPYIKLLVALTPHQAPSLPTHKKESEPTPRPVKKATPPPKDVPSPATSDSVSVSIPIAASHEFSWQGLLDTIKAEEAGLYTLLTRSDYTFDGANLVIFCGRPFNKKRVDKSLPYLIGTLVTMGYSDVQIATEPVSKPPEDSQAASIIAMMGGGEPITPDA